MEKIIYSEQFYVNDFPDKGYEYAKQFVETFMNKPPQNLFDFLAEKDHFGKLNPEFQAVIIGEPKTSLFGKPQAAILIVHSNFIAYTTNPNHASPVRVNYGYATFDNEISVAMKDDQLELMMPYEAILIGVHSNSAEEDYRVLKSLVEQNISAIKLFREVLPKGEKPDRKVTKKEQNEKESNEPAKTRLLFEVEGKPAILPEEERFDTARSADERNEWFEEQTDTVMHEDSFEATEVDGSKVNDTAEIKDVKAPDLIEVNEPDLITFEEPKRIEFDKSELIEVSEAEVDEIEATDLNENEGFEDIEAEIDLNKEWGHNMMDENIHDKTEETKQEFVKEDEHLSTEQDMVRNYNKNEEAIDPRFRTKQPIISNDSIPKGYVYAEPVIYANSVRPGLFKSSTAKSAYLKAYDACLEEMIQEINEGRFDAVFNLRFTTQSIENYYDVVVTGDAAVYASH